MQFSLRPGVARQLALAAGVLSVASFLSSCTKGGGDFAKTKSGIEYKIFKNVGGKYESREVAGGEDASYKDRVGKVMSAHIEYLTSGDSVMMKSRERQFGIPVRIPLETLTAKQMGAEPEAFSLLQPGDSGVFRFNADTLYKRNAHQLAPANLKKKGNFIILTVKAVALQTRDAAMAEAMADQQKMMAEQQRQMRAYAATQDKADDAVLQDYIKKNNLTNAKKDPSGSGVYIITTQPGTGPNAKAGQIVTVQYRGLLLDGKEFDASAKHGGQPFSFPLGRGQVIPGWDAALAQLNKGSKATILIPSSLAYGKQGSPPAIPANSPLRFDIELTDVKDAPAQAQAPAMAPPAGR
ncbi:FKBP-type peptidyl-prolyl cis-trans isomerase [Hymenobacter baengnokdamensis]|uniref:FKBP-type peptidyl-prolyl cis-trans isomerase n=1 Tax=Hymenobacter baengnokdamensis TaxID=2615203 RepID=UPI001E5166E0|nr:FKBP-type peptidyl-prolyl cis-trans isomerase [Hymenobacter baengnokdamensis]